MFIEMMKHYHDTMESLMKGLKAKDAKEIETALLNIEDIPKELVPQKDNEVHKRAREILGQMKSDTRMNF